MKKSYLHRGGEEPLLGLTIPEHFRRIAERYPEREAIVSLPQGRRLTYGKLADRIDKLARSFLGIGIQRGDRVGIWSVNNIEWLLVQMATARIGAVLVNLNPAYRPRELAYALRKSRVQCVVTIPSFRTSDYVGMLTELLPELKEAGASPLPGPPAPRLESEEFPDLHTVVVYDPTDPLGFERPYPGVATCKGLADAGKQVPMAELDRVTSTLDMDDPINIQYTSGTTGYPKAVILTHRNVLNNAYFCAQAMNFTQADRLCVPIPFYHCFGMVISTMLCFSTGACLVIPCEHFDPLRVLQAVDRERCTALHGVPTMFVSELDHPRFSEFNLTSLRTGIMAGAPCPPALMTRVMAEMHIDDILIGYGQTEASPVTHLTTRDDTFERRVETVGTNLPHQEVKVVDVETGETVPVGRVGEVCFRGYHVMRGYYDDPEATAEALDEAGWLHSGDLGTMDEDGYVRITGRLKEMIIRGGENIYPREIEDFLYTHPKIAEVSVFGIPDEFYGEETMAWIELQADKEATEEEIREFCKRKIAHYKIPTHIWFVDEFPLTVTGKIKKYRMREMAVAKMEETKAAGEASDAEGAPTGAPQPA
jgi:fatty-acyl-CoA synthase